MVNKSLGNGIATSGIRTYKIINSKYILIGWIQRRCERCQRFLSKKEYRFCSKHGTHNEVSKLWNKNNRESCTIRERNYRNRNKERTKQVQHEYYIRNKNIL